MSESIQLIIYAVVAISAGSAWAWPSGFNVPSIGYLFGKDDADAIAEKIDEHLKAVSELRGRAARLLAQASDEASKLREIAQ